MFSLFNFPSVVFKNCVKKVNIAVENFSVIFFLIWENYNDKARQKMVTKSKLTKLK